LEDDWHLERAAVKRKKSSHKIDESERLIIERAIALVRQLRAGDREAREPLLDLLLKVVTDFCTQDDVLRDDLTGPAWRALYRAVDRIARGTPGILRLLAHEAPDLLGYIRDLMRHEVEEQWDLEAGHLKEPRSTRSSRKRRTGRKEDRSIYRRPGSLDQSEGLSLCKGKDDWTVVPVNHSTLETWDRDTVERQALMRAADDLEYEVLVRRAEGMPLKRIARELGKTTWTVRKALNTIREREEREEAEEE
jgi:DNA-directed RNA polymerase specialized sigma24 family protein